VSKLKPFLAALAALFALLLASRAEASHFRYGNITWTVPDPVNAPLSVRFDVTVAWREDYPFIDSTTLNFGNGKTNPPNAGATIGTGTDAAGLEYLVQRYTVTHKYAAPGVYTVFFTSCCRTSNLINAGDDSFRVEAKVDVTGNGKKGNPVSAVPAIIQLQTGGVRTIQIPAVDPNGLPVTCRFGTINESQIGQNPPVVPATGAPATVAASASPPGCVITWNTTGGFAGQQFAINVVMESVKNGNTSSAVVDFITEFVSTPPPTCSGSNAFTLDMGDNFTHSVVGTNNAGGNLLMSVIGAVGLTSPPTGTTQNSPFTTSFNWNPGPGEEGTSVLTIVYKDQNNSSGYCSLSFTVLPCPGFGQACTSGVGGCKATGTTYCDGANVLCTAMPSQPQQEICDGVDNDCNGMTDEGNPQAGAPCMTGLPGACSMGTSDCPGGVLSCIPTVAPGSLAETCNGEDDNCDGVVDDGYNIGQLCSEGGGGCQSQGFIVCDGMGGAECSATPGVPQPEVCNGIDDNCDMAVDEGFGVGTMCSVGVGVCQANGAITCDGKGGTQCNAVAGPPQGEEICGNAADEDCDGLIDNGCADSDGDTLFDKVENDIGTNPNDADSDDDGVADNLEPQAGEDSDGDGVINGLDVDSDNDGLFDGTEMGLDCGGPGTNAEAGHCVPDADGGATTTDPLSADSDMGGGTDGSEDSNLNGVVDAGEGDPGQPGDDGGLTDSDGDGLSDAVEIKLGSRPDDADTDDDGALDGDEPNPSDDGDRDGLNTLRDCDSDNDALFDGTEMGFGCMNPNTDTAVKRCRKDNDLGATKTSPLLRDTDNGGVFDGAEDPTLNGAVGSGELNPNKYLDDANVVDSDSDGLSDALEIALKSKVDDADTDDDGVIDGDEPNPSDDSDLDGKLNVLDADSDNDGLFDGTELGIDCSHPATAAAKEKCIADHDFGMTRTSPLLEDTDGGTAPDGDEDANKNGIVDEGERDPLNPTDDLVMVECMSDFDCGAEDSGVVCDANKCIPGCRGQSGNKCPVGQSCSSMDITVGTCSPDDTSSSSTGGVTPINPEAPGGCGCRLEETSDASPFGSGLLMTAAAAALAVLRRQRRSPGARK
jgi:MYXO-CTERM domain-containing protein